MPYRDHATKIAHDETYRAAHRAELAAKQRAYYQEHKQESFARARKISKARPWYYRATTFANVSNRRARQEGVAGKLFGREVKMIVGPCTYCSGEQETWDHVIPLCRGGANDLTNLAPACHRCNRAKARRLPDGIEADGPDPERVRRGENNHGALLTAIQVQEMRERYRQGGISLRRLALEYKISKSQAHAIITRQEWAWLHD